MKAAISTWKKSGKEVETSTEIYCLREREVVCILWFNESFHELVAEPFHFPLYLVCEVIEVVTHHFTPMLILKSVDSLKIICFTQACMKKINSASDTEFLLLICLF